MGKKKKEKLEKDIQLLELELQYGSLMINHLKHETRMRKESQRLSKKRKVGYIT